VTTAGVAAGLALASALLCAPLAAQDAAPARLPSIELPAELDRVLRDYAAAWTAGDAAALAALFTEDGYVPGPGGWVTGRDAIRAQYANAGGDLRLRALSYAIEGDVGWIVGAYGYGDGAATQDGGKFVLALRRGDDGRWLIAADIDNANRRPGPS
jgi:ketosteroid isomerase-like protein